MIAALCLLWMAASTSVQLVDEVYQIPRDDWRYVELDLKQRPALVHAYFNVESGPPKVRLALMRREDFERLRHDEPHGALDITPAGASESFVYQVRDRGDYVIVVDNRADGSAKAAVRLRVSLFFGPTGPTVTFLSPRRRLVVVLLSFAIFFGIVTISGRQLWRAIRR